MQASYIHVHSMRLASGQEALVCRALAENGAVGYGFSFRLEATEARHMAMFEAGLRNERPRITPVLGHPWETAWVSNTPIPWDVEPGFSRLQWLPQDVVSQRRQDMGTMVSFKRPDGQPVNGYLAEPAQAERAPGIVVIQEWWGLNDQIKGVADRLAKAGYRALVPDLYRGKVTVEAKEAEHLMTKLNFADAAAQDIRGAVQYLKSTGSPKVGVTGFCMGGALALLAAANVPEADAIVVWYGYPPLEYLDATKIKAPLLGHFGTDDAAFPIEKVDELEKKLREAKVPFEFHRYKVKHAFANEKADTKKLPMLEYNPEAAELAWRRTMEFFDRHLKR